MLFLCRCGRRLPTQRRSFIVDNLLCRQKNIIDVRTGRIVRTLDDFVSTRRYVTCTVTPDQSYILIGEEMVTKLFDFEQGTLLATFPAENLPCIFVVSEDVRLVYVGYVEDCIFKVCRLVTISHFIKCIFHYGIKPMSSSTVPVGCLGGVGKINKRHESYVRCLHRIPTFWKIRECHGILFLLTGIVWEFLLLNGEFFVVKCSFHL